MSYLKIIVRDCAKNKDVRKFFIKEGLIQNEYGYFNNPKFEQMKLGKIAKRIIDND